MKTSPAPSTATPVGACRPVPTGVPAVPDAELAGYITTSFKPESATYRLPAASTAIWLGVTQPPPMVDCAAGRACTAAPVPLPSRGMEASSVLFAPSMTSVAETLPADSGAKLRETGQLVRAAYGGCN